ncbi:MAG: DUF6603 domain-containing protein [Pyrinomonadaceae bacterium]
MAEGKPLSTTDLFLLTVGLYALKPPLPRGAASGKDYYLDKEKDYALRETEWNTSWFSGVKDAWEGVRHRDWLLANLAANLTGSTNDLGAISEPVFISLDLLGSEFKPGMPNASDAIKQAVTSKNGYSRSIFTTLTVGLSDQESAGQRVIVLGAGMRRRTRVWKEASQALQADVEFFVPFLPLPSGKEPADKKRPNARSINAGIRISRANGSSIGTGGPDDAQVDLAAVRFNLRVPFTARAVDRYDEATKSFYFSDAPDEPFKNPFPSDYKWEAGDLLTAFDDPTVEAQMLPLKGVGTEPPKWQAFKEWKKFIETFCPSTEGNELLNAPIGPLLLDTVADSSGVLDILKSHRGDIMKDLEEVQKELDEAEKLLKGIWNKNIPDASKQPSDPDSSSSMRRLGGLLESLGLLSGKPGKTDVKYSPAKLSELTVWDVLNRTFEELDGFPLYLYGVTPKEKDGKRIAVTLASQSAPDAPRKHYFGIAGAAYNIPINTTSKKKKPKPEDEAEEDPVFVLGQNYFVDEDAIVEDDEDDGDAQPEKDGEKDGKKSGVDLRLQLGKWFSGETLDDNWFRRLLPPAGTEKSPWKRRVPLPGIRLFPFQRTLSADNNKDAVYTLALRGDLLSLGVDVKGRTKEGLKFLQLEKGPLTYFGLGAFEARIALLWMANRVAFGIGIKLKDMRLSFGKKEESEEKKPAKPAGNEIILGLGAILWDDDEPAAPAPAERKPKTRLTAKKKDKFSLSVGYLSPLKDGSPGTLDVQLYDEKGVRGKLIWIPIERGALGVYIRDIGIGLKGFENFEPGQDFADGALLTVALTGGLRWPSFELGFIGASIGFPLKEMGALQFGLDGLDVSFKAGPVVISGSFLKNGLEYAGSLTIELPKISFAAIGFYGPIVLFDMKTEADVLNALAKREVHDKLKVKLAENNITPIKDQPVSPDSTSNWQISATDGRSFTLLDDGGKLHLLGPGKALFIYGVVSAGSGGGPRLGPIQLKAIAFGFGLNRRLVVPPIEDVADFPLVKMVMGEGGYQDEDESGTFIGQVSKAVEPATLLKDMGEALVAEAGQYFVCFGARFTIAEVVDCFALVVVQFGNEFELSLLGLARFKQPSDLNAKPICYVEMQLLMVVKPKDGVFKLQALLTSNSWVLNQDCKLTGGFAVYAWFDGPHKGDVVVTLGGYHPRFKRPDHYPIVPRLGLNWQISPQLSVKGEAYLAFTPSCGMVGARLEAVFRSNRVTVWFTAYLDVIVNWSPLSFEADIGITLRIEVSLFLFTLKLTLGLTLKMWGPPVGGVVYLHLAVISLPIPFGAQPETPQPIESWELFCRSFLSPSEADEKSNDPKSLKANDPKSSTPPITQPSLVSGRSNFADLPQAQTKPQATQPDDGSWKVRPDLLELGAAASVPVTTLNVGRVKTNSPPVGVQERNPSGNSLLVAKPVELEAAGLHVKEYGKPLGVHPMGRALKSVLNVTVVRDDVSETTSIDLSNWLVETETTSLPAALWDSAKPKPNGPREPSADLVPDCITGIKRLKPPAGQRGARTSLTQMTWHALDPSIVPRTDARQDSPSKMRPRDVQTAAAAKQDAHARYADALAAVGFTLTWRPPQAQVRFRDLQAEPLSGAVAPSAA